MGCLDGHLRAIQSLYSQSKSRIRKLGLFSVYVGLHQACPLSLILFVVYRISTHDLVLLASSGNDPQCALERFVAEFEVDESQALLSLRPRFSTGKRQIAPSYLGVSLCLKQRS
ncbi:hypothetical protein XENORESO_016521 [Xenotaenia resolanae]|uniref:Uncharacterized protein n=1 Tax=Xenotaenia resolanae TaxID=208358 RepID=A0ABV0W672_9TELE